MHTFQYVELTGSGNLNCLRDIRRVSEHRENFDHMCKAPARPDLYQLTSAPSFNWKLLKVKTIEILSHECDFFHNLSHFKKYFVNFILQRGEKAWDV